MRLPLFALRFAAGTATLLWIHLWKWSYPRSSPVINELAARELDLLGKISSLSKLARICIDLPGIARSQQLAESSPSTRTSGHVEGELPPVEPEWKGRLREWLIWTVLASWLVMATSIVTSFVQMGNFLLDYSPNAGEPEIISPYSRVVAIALLVQIVSVSTGLTALRIRR
ncbi:MAG: hypothetical protein O3B95_01100 [Chloroflexi bacterium]|nr:hypothetical protein [Chloroflexota bacterium]